ncbi:MAG TPA: DUF3606 domain-containing protein [Burkholderiaceae bacterium]|nr:DUF3606 domain-containing protein [Burkholderiaceae bacterium]
MEVDEPHRAESHHSIRRINLHEPGEIEFWSARLGCTPNQLRAAVMAAGTLARSVRSYLVGRKKRS